MYPKRSLNYLMAKTDHRFGLEPLRLKDTRDHLFPKNICVAWGLGASY